MALLAKLVRRLAHLGNQSLMARDRISLRIPWLRAQLNRQFNQVPQSAINQLVARLGKIERPGLFDWKYDFAGRTMQVPVRPEFPRSWSIALSTRWQEPNVIRVYERLAAALNQPGTFIDVGANYGLHAIRFLMLGFDCRLFEPQEECRGYLALISQINGFNPDVSPLALSSESGEQTFWTSQSTWFSSLEKDFIGTKETLAPVTIHTARLDAILLAKLQAPVILKIDVEGHERSTLEGASNFLKDQRPIVFIEICEKSGNRQPIFEQLTQLGYSCFSLESNRAVAIGNSAGLATLPSDEFLFTPEEQLTLTQQLTG